MGTLVGHVAPGFGFLVIGLWHLYNHIRLYSLRPSSYVSPPWFPTARLRHLEPYLIIAGSLASISMELVIGPAKHNPLDDDGTIPSNHLHNFEHAAISLSLLVYATFAIALDRLRSQIRQCEEISMLLAAAAFAQQLLMFRLHSADHIGVEGQYHLLLQTVVVVSLGGTLIGIARRRNFLVSFVRSASIILQGVWFIIMGFMLWTPGLIPKGCFLNLEDGHDVVRCRTEAALHRAKSLVNLQFSWCLTAMAVFCVLVYVFMSQMYPEEPQYLPIVKDAAEAEEEEELGSPSQTKLMESASFVGNGLMRAMDLESAEQRAVTCEDGTVVVRHCRIAKSL